MQKTITERESQAWLQYYSRRGGNTYTGINIKYRKIWKCICGEKMAIGRALEAKDDVFDVIATVKYFPETDSYLLLICVESVYK